MFDEIERFVNWIRRRNPQAHTWRDYRCDLQQFVAVVVDRGERVDDGLGPEVVGDRLPRDVPVVDIEPTNSTIRPSTADALTWPSEAMAWETIRISSSSI